MAFCREASFKSGRSKGSSNASFLHSSATGAGPSKNNNRNRSGRPYRGNKPRNQNKNWRSRVGADNRGKRAGHPRAVTQPNSQPDRLDTDENPLPAPRQQRPTRSQRRDRGSYRYDPIASSRRISRWHQRHMSRDGDIPMTDAPVPRRHASSVKAPRLEVAGNNDVQMLDAFPLEIEAEYSQGAFGMYELANVLLQYVHGANRGTGDDNDTEMSDAPSF